MKNFKSKIMALIILPLFLLSSCAALSGRDDVKDIELKYKATGDYLAVGDTLETNKANIINYCNAKGHTSDSCLKAKDLYNISTDLYAIAGEYFKALHDPANSALYMGNAVLIAGQLDDNLFIITKQEAETLVSSVNEIIEASDHDDPTIEALQIINVINLKLVPTITEIVVREN